MNTDAAAVAAAAATTAAAAAAAASTTLEANEKKTDEDSELARVGRMSLYDLHKYCYYKTTASSHLHSNASTKPGVFLQGDHLCRASGQGELGLVKSLVEVLDVPVDSKDRCGRTALHCACQRGHVGVVLYLLDKHADREAQEPTDGLTPLHMAAFRNDVSIARCLVQHGAKVSSKTALGWDRKGLRPPLHIASERGHVEMCKFLLDAGAKVDEVNADGSTALHFACNNNQPGTSELLLAHGADPNAKNVLGSTAMLMATDMNVSLAVFELLLKNGARVDEPCDGYTPLTNACRHNYTNIVRLLAKHGADVNYSRNGCPVLVKACCQNDAEVVRCLVECGADINKKDLCDGATPLITSAEYGHPDIVKYLLSKGADVHARTYNRMTAIQMAIFRGQHQAFHVLRQYYVLNGLNP